MTYRLARLQKTWVVLGHERAQSFGRVVTSACVSDTCGQFHVPVSYCHLRQGPQVTIAQCSTNMHAIYHAPRKSYAHPLGMYCQQVHVLEHLNHVRFCGFLHINATTNQRRKLAVAAGGTLIVRT